MIQNKILTVIGHKGYGKTTLTEKLIIELNKPTVILDPRMQYEENIRRIVFTSVSKFQKFITKRDNFKLFMQYKLELVVNAMTQEDAELLASMVYKMKEVTFLIDEIDMFFDTRTNKESYFKKLVHYARHNQIDLVTTSRRPANINRDLTSQTDFFYFSRLREPNDQKYIKALLGNEYVKQVAELEKFSFMKVDDEKKEIIKTTLKDLEILS